MHRIASRGNCIKDAGIQLFAANIAPACYRLFSMAAANALFRLCCSTNRIGVPHAHG